MGGTRTCVAVVGSASSGCVRPILEVASRASSHHCLRGWLPEQLSNGLGTHWNDKFREVTTAITIDLDADDDCVKDPLAWLRIGECERADVAVV